MYAVVEVSLFILFLTIRRKYAADVNACDTFSVKTKQYTVKLLREGRCK